MAETSGQAARPFAPALDVARLQLQARPWLRGAVPAAAMALLALLAGLYYVRAPGVVRFVFDDSYISLTFARNLAAHGKLTFDGHNWSTGATSLLHVSALALLIKAGFDPFKASVYFGVLSHVLLALGVFWLGWAVFRSLVAATAAAGIIALTNYAAFDAGNGMETTLFMALVAASLAAVLTLTTPRGRLAAGALIGLAILTRPEGVFLIPAAALYMLATRDPEATWRATAFDIGRAVVPGIAVLAILSAFSLAVTGKLTPGTGTVKLQFFQDDTLALKRKLQIAGDFMGLFWGPMFPTLLIGLLAPRRRELLLLAFFWVPTVVFYIWFFPGGLSHYFYRYQHPVLPLLAVLAGGGVAALFDWVARNDVLGQRFFQRTARSVPPGLRDRGPNDQAAAPPTSRAMRTAAASVPPGLGDRGPNDRAARPGSHAVLNDLMVKALAVVALVVLLVPLWEEFQNWRILYRDASFETLVDLESMARDLNTIVQPDQTLATHDIGAVGYFADYHVLDLVGLVNPDVVKFHDGRHVSDYINAVRPDYLLIFPSWDADFLHIYPGDHPEQFELVKVYPGRNIRPDPYLLYRIKYPVTP